MGRVRRGRRRVEGRWLSGVGLELSRTRCGLKIGSQSSEDKAEEGITLGGGAMSHVRTLKNEPDAEWQVLRSPEAKARTGSPSGRGVLEDLLWGSGSLPCMLASI